MPTSSLGPLQTASPPVALIALEQEWAARSYESILGPSGYAVVRANSGGQLLSLVGSTRPDVVIIDSRLPDMSGNDACLRMREHEHWNPHTAILISTWGTADRDQRLAAYRCGAWEFVGQPLDGEALLLRLENYVRAKRECDRARGANLVDPATGLYTVDGLARRIRELGAAALRHSEAFACIAFAPVPRDAPGESLPAEVLSASTLQLEAYTGSAGRASDVLGHLGPAEFAIIAPGTNSEGAMRLTERLRAAVEDVPILVRGREYRLSINAAQCAVADIAKSSIDAIEILLRAAAALRQSSHTALRDGLRPLEASAPN
ncbi:MAG: response regulator [Gemmatimonadaceae bacterium]